MTIANGQKSTNEIEVREQPHNDEAELCCIGAVLIFNLSFYEVEEVLGADAWRCFYRETSRIIWRAMSEIFEAFDGDVTTNVIDIITLADHLSARGLLDKIGGPHYLARLSSDVPSAANVVYYARIVRKYHLLRTYAVKARQFVERTYDPAEDPDALIRDMTGDLAQLITPAGDRRKTALATDQAWGERFDALLAGRVAGYSTGIAQLDALLDGGLQLSRSYYLGGLTKMGKSTLAIHLAAQWAFKHGGAVDWWSVEMSEEDLEDKFLGWKTGFSPSYLVERLRAQGPTAKNDKMFADLIKARAEFCEADIEFEVCGSPDIRHIESATLARQTRLQGQKPLMLVVDYMQNLTNGNSKSNEYERLSEISRRLNGISKDRKIVVIVLFQFDKEAEKTWLNQRKIPRFSNLRGTSQAGNDANHFLILHRNWRDKPGDDKNIRYTEILQDLSRHGRLGESVALDCDLATCRFSEWEGEEPPAAAAWAAEQSKRGGGGNYER